MFVDTQLTLSDAQAITAAAASTHYINLGVARDAWIGEVMKVVVCIDVAFTDDSSDSTLTVTARYDSTTTFTPDATQDLMIIPALAAAGGIYVANLDPMIATRYQYMQLYYTPNNGNLTTGTVTSFITYGAVQKNIAYADAITFT